MNAKSIKANSTEALKNQLEESLSDGFKPTLAIVFLWIKMDRMVITEILDQKGIAVFGATSSGEFIDKVTEKKSVVIFLLDMNPDYFHIYFEEYPEKTIVKQPGQPEEISKCII